MGSRRLVLRIVDWTNDYRPAYSTHKGSKDDAVYEMGWTGLGGTAWNNEGNMYNLALERIDESIKYALDPHYYPLPLYPRSSPHLTPPVTNLLTHTSLAPTRTGT